MNPNESKKMDDRVLFACTREEKLLWQRAWPRDQWSRTMRTLANAAAALKLRKTKGNKT